MESSKYINDKAEIEKLIKELDLEEAKSRLEVAVKEFPQSSEFLDLFGEVLMSLNYFKEAKKILEKSIQMAPNANGEKYMTYGQLLDKPSKKLSNYNKGADIYRTQLQAGSSTLNPEDLENLRFSLSSSLATIAELYMTTELCDKEGAEDSCEKALSEAIQVCDINPDVLIQYANLRILRMRDKEAREYMEKALELILSSKNTDHFPDSELICTLAKNFAELGDYYNATKVLDILTKLDDQNLEYWYLLAFNHFKLKNYILSQNCIDNLNEIQEKVKEVDQELFEGAAELAQELRKIELSNGKLSNNPLLDMDEDDEEHRNNNSMNIDDE